MRILPGLDHIEKISCPVTSVHLYGGQRAMTRLPITKKDLIRDVPATAYPIEGNVVSTEGQVSG